MISLALDTDLQPSNPLDLLEEFISLNEWQFDRVSDSELALQITGTWTDFTLWFVWHDDLQAIYFACHFDMRIPRNRRTEVQGLVAQVNERLWLGHFELGQEDGSALFRHTVPLRGTEGISIQQLEDLVEAAVTECDRFYPALQLVVWGGQKAGDAVAVTMMDTVGTA